MARALMIQGTASHVGKSVVTAAVGCWVARQGLRVAPFKAQNMSLNSFVTLRGEEIARSQAAQAEALGLEPSADMNPILLKPMENGCQVIIQGRGIGVLSIHDYYALKPRAWQAITEAYDRLAATVDVVVLEGAGSPAEINLKAHDLVNMRMAAYANAAVVLVADIERGGVFAQLVGTWELLEPSERARIVGFVINKFRGDRGLLTSGLDFIQQRTGKPVLGVLPFDAKVQLDEEDSLGLDARAGPTAEIDVAVVRLPGLSNFTDCAPLTRAAGVALRYITDPAQLGRPDLLILPGTRTTMRALQWLRAAGFVEALQRLAHDPTGPLLLGLCGGYQLLGHTINDADGIEEQGSVAGLGLLDIDTVFEPRKTLTRVTATAIAPHGLACGATAIGYEVHQGVSTRRAGALPWLQLCRQPGGEVILDGAMTADGRVAGTYVHGLFDDARFCAAILAELRQRRGLPPQPANGWLGQREYRREQANQLADWLAAHCDLRPLATGGGLRVEG